MNSKKCLHRNKAIEDIYKVCKDCGEVLEENHKFSVYEPVRKTMGRNEIKSEDAMYFRSGIRHQKVEKFREIGKQHNVKDLKNKRKAEIEKENACETKT